MKIWAIGWNVFREAVRDKVLFNLLFFSLLMIVGAGVLSTLTVGERTRIIIDIGLAAMSLFGTLIAIFLGVSLVSKEIDRRTIYNILSKPILRFQFLLGKYLGLAITLGVNLALMCAVFVALFVFMGQSLSPALLAPIGMIYLELLVVVAVSLFFSTFTTGTLSAIFALAVYLIGHLSAVVLSMVQQSEGIARGFGYLLYYLLPNFENFNYKKYASHLAPIPDGQIEISLGYGVAYIAFTLALATWVFQYREFK